MVENIFMITGKFNMSQKQANEIGEIYDKHYFEVPKKDSFEGCKQMCGCAKKKVVPPEQLEKERKEKEFEELINNCYDSLLGKSMDLKYMMQIYQDVELIRKVLFKKRHMVLRHFVALESEKRFIERKKKEEAGEEVVENL